MARHLDDGCVLIGFTEMRTERDGMKCTFHANPWYNGGPWYDWAYVQYLEKTSGGNEITRYYPSLVLGFIQFDVDEECHAVIRTSTKNLPWDVREKEFVSSFSLSTDFKKHYELAPLSSIVHPIYAFKDYGGMSTDYFCTLPKRNWAQYFDDKIVITQSDTDSNASESSESDYDDDSLDENDDSSGEHSYNTVDASSDEDSVEETSDDSVSQDDKISE